MSQRFSPRVVGLILLMGIFLIAGFFLRNHRYFSPSVGGWSLWETADHSPAGTQVRVNVTPRGKAAWDLEIAGKFSIHAGDSGRILFTEDRLGKCKLSRDHGRWKISPAVSNLQLPEGDLLIRPQEGAIIRLDRHRYRGELLLTTSVGGRPLLINRLPLEQYVASVVDGEMPTEFGHEARCAQAVIARSYVLYQQQQAIANELPYDVHSDTRSQNYLGYQYQGGNGAWYAGETTEGRQCAEATRGLVCSDPDQMSLFCTYYSAVCGGQACRGNELFPDASRILVPVECHHCRESPLYRWERSIRLNRFQSRVQAFLRNRGFGNPDWKSWINEDRSLGALPKFRISDGNKNYSLSGFDLRNLFGGDLLPSPLIQLEIKDKEVLIHGAGHGHGVGLCQWGARGLARQGKSFRQILEFYYPGSRLTDYRSLKRPPIASVPGNSAGRKGVHISSPR